MKKAREKRLRDAGWSVGGASEFLGLTYAEAVVVEIKVALATSLRRQRTSRHVSQAAMAKRIGSSQSRVAKMEAGDPSVSLELLIRSLLVTGAKKREIARLIA